MDQETSKYILITPPAAIYDNTSPGVTEIDCKDWDELEIVVALGASDIAVAACKVTESDTAGSGHTDVTGLVFGTSTNTDGSTSTLPSATDDNKLFGFHIDLRKRKRYIDMVLTAGDGTSGTFITVWARLSRGKSVPNTAATRGFSQVLRV